TEFRGLRCEVQVHTRAGNLWSEANHDLVYKAAQDVPLELQRRVYRLLALVELFDNEMASTRQLIQDSPGYEDAVLIAELERRFYKLTATRFDHEFALANVAFLRKAYSGESNTDIVARV